MSTTVPFLIGTDMITTDDMIRQEFDTGDLVQLTGPIGAKGLYGLVTKSKRISELPVCAESQYRWHKDEYHCLIRLTTGETEWVRAKFLTIVSKAADKRD